MPVRAPSACKRSGCAGHVRNGVCSQCGSLKRATNAAHDETRGNNTERGYDGNWRKVRAMFLRAHPLCQDCQAAGRVTMASEVHHLIKVRDGGAHRDDNLVALCKPCHSARTGKGE